MPAADRAGQAFSLIGEPGFLPAFLRWPKFSCASFLMVARLARLGLRPRTILDVGANTGQFAVSAAKRFPQAAIHSFEPLPECYAKLRSMAARLGNVETRALALGDTVGELAFHVNTHTHSSSVLPLADEHRKAFPWAREAREITVKASTLDHEYRDKTLIGPVLLKLDVQGYEAKVLKGGTETISRIDHIVAEMSFKPLYRGEWSFHQTLNLLDGLDFDLVQPVGFLKDPTSGTYLQMDGLFARRSRR